MKLLKRKDSLTFKREKPLAKQERIYSSAPSAREANRLGNDTTEEARSE